MKKVVYIIVSVSLVLAIAAVTVGCNVSSEHKQPKAYTYKGLSMSQNHMNYNYCYSFYLREEDGKVLFDAQLRLDEEPYEIVLESCEVDSSSMTKLRAIEQKYSIVEYVENFKKKKSPFQVLDETVNKTSVYYNDVDMKTADTGSDYEEELYEFFVSLTKEYESHAVSE